ncbi:MAG: hypothetical protein CL521_05665, partial [Actinobacteria bacterium]|nr:hypothetical protein [Actinomycetota bacterium]
MNLWYYYRTLDEKGHRTQGLISEVEKEWTVYELKRNKEGANIELTNLGPILSAVCELVFKSFYHTILRPRLSKDQLLLFTQELQELLASGLQVLDAMIEMKGLFISLSYRLMVNRMITNIKKGKKLSDCLMEYNYLFPDIYIVGVKTGERVGKLQEILKENLLFLEWKSKEKKEMMSMIYGIARLVGLIGIFIYVLAFIFAPELHKAVYYKETTLMRTKISLDILMAINTYLIPTLKNIVVGVIALYILGRIKGVRYRYHQGILKIPMINGAVKMFLVTKMFKHFYLLEKNGVKILQCFDILNNVSDNLVYQKEIQAIKSQLIEGKRLSSTFEHKQVFPKLVSKILRDAELSGRLGGKLNQIAILYKKLLEIRSKLVMKIASWTTLILAGGILGWIYYCL